MPIKNYFPEERRGYFDPLIVTHITRNNKGKEEYLLKVVDCFACSVTDSDWFEVSHFKSRKIDLVNILKERGYDVEVRN